MERHNPLAPVAPRGNAAAHLGPLLGQLGLRASDERALVAAAVTDALAGRQLGGELLSLRYHVATVHTDPHSAALLAYDRDHLLGQVNARLTEAGADPLTELRITTRRPPGHTSEASTRTGQGPHR